MILNAKRVYLVSQAEDCICCGNEECEVSHTSVMGVFFKEKKARKFIKQARKQGRYYFIEYDVVVGDIVATHNQYVIKILLDNREIIEIQETKNTDVSFLDGMILQSWRSQEEGGGSYLEIPCYARDLNEAKKIALKEFDEHIEYQKIVKKRLELEKEQYEKDMKEYFKNPTKENYNKLV